MKLLFYPDPPKSFHKIIDVCRRSDMDVVKDHRSPHDLIIHWDYKTFCPVDSWLYDRYNKIQIINYGVVDVCKSMVDDVFFDVFKKRTLVDPFSRCSGNYIRKSEKQASHDAKIVAFPQGYESGYVFQKIFDSRVSFTKCRDIRLPIFANEIPFAFLKYRDITSPIKSIDHVEIETDLRVLFAQREIDLIKKFAETFFLDFGEIDIIRNNFDQEMYIIDVNNMAGNGLYKYLSPVDLEFVQATYADLFKLKFLS